MVKLTCYMYPGQKSHVFSMSMKVDLVFVYVGGPRRIDFSVGDGIRLDFSVGIIID